MKHKSRHETDLLVVVMDDYLTTPGKAGRKYRLDWGYFSTWCRDKSHANSQTVVVGTIGLRPLYKVSKGRCMQGWAEKPRGQVGISRSLQRVLYTTRYELLTNYWVSMNDYKLMCHISINNTSYCADWAQCHKCWHLLTHQPNNRTMLTET